MKTVAIIGGGIAGLTAAVGLAKIGWRVSVFEAAHKFEDVGAGIQLSQNATYCLMQLGLDLSQLPAMRPDATELYSFKGPRLMTVRHDQSGDAPYLQTHRADLIAFLVTAAETAGVEIHLSAEAVIKAKDHGQYHVDVNGAEHNFELVVSADGVHSTAVARDDHPKSSAVAWRGLIDRDLAPDRFKSGPQVILGPRRHIVTYPLRDGALINLVAVEEVSGEAEQGWLHSADPAELRAIFADFGHATHELLQSVRSVRRWALTPHTHAEMVGQFGQPVIGDAALTMLPYMAQGAAMGIEDAFALTKDIEGGPMGWVRSTADARATRKEQVMKAARANGRLFHLYPKVIGPFIHFGMALIGRIFPKYLTHRYAWIYEERV